jgi:para-nitrobenzyl esterase
VSAIAEVETGALAGKTEPAGRSRRPVHAFHGVPYAAPPTGELRFRAPQPAQPWRGLLPATAAGPVPMQALAGPFAGLIPGSSVSAASEDCLTLEIWAPAEAGNLPVMLWVPGGAFLTGGASLPTYDGSALAADHDVVVVGVNYRLGAFGFAWLEPLGSAGPDANCGLRDLLAALDWVARNIAAFGGDPNNVTAFGESAGAGALLHLLSSTAQLPLRRCVLQSPGVDHTLRADQGELVTEVLVRHLGDGQLDITRLQAVPAEAILGAQERTVAELMSVVSAMPFHPVVDGDLLLTTPSIAFADGAAAEIDLMVSWTADEMRLFPNPAADEGGIEAITEWTRALLTRRLGEKPDNARVHQLVTFYQDRSAALGLGQPADLWSAILTDGVMRLPCRRIADSHASNGGITYATEFSWRGSVPEGAWDPRAFHAIDLPFTFGTLDGCGWREFLQAGPDADRLCIGHMEAWSTFARTGQPESPELPKWSRYTAGTRPTMILDAPAKMRNDPLAPVAEAWSGLWSPDSRAPAL